MKHSIVKLLGIVLAISITPRLWGDAPNSLTTEERQQGFELIFNGVDLAGWTHGGNWTVTDGVMTREGKGGSLVYSARTLPDDFELRFAWKVGPGSNSGVYYRPGQNEYQILDNAKHRDGENPRTSAASLYFGMAPSRDATRPVGEWNEARIVCKGTVVQHWLNGEAVVNFDYSDPKWKENVALLKARGGDVTARGANLSLQDHGDPVWFRSFKLRSIPATEPIQAAADFKPASIPPAMLERERSIIDTKMKKATKKPKAARAAQGKGVPPLAAVSPSVIEELVQAIGGDEHLLRIFRMKERLAVGNDPNAEGKERSSVLQPPQHWWLGKKDRVIDDREPATFLVAAWTLVAFVDPQARLEPISEDSARNHVFGIRISDTIDPPMDCFFDQQTKRLVSIEWRDSRHEFSDWKESHGTHYPSKCVGYKLKDGKHWYHTEILEIERLASVPDKLLNGS